MSLQSSGSHELATEKLVVDASAVVRACLSETVFAEFHGRHLTAPPLLWSEVPSSFHQALWRKAIPGRLANLALDRFLGAEIERVEPGDLVRRSWEVAESLGWAKTYDAEYVALAQKLDLPLVTIDGRLKRGAERLIETISPDEL